MKMTAIHWQNMDLRVTTPEIRSRKNYICQFFTLSKSSPKQEVDKQPSLTIVILVM